jgi:hypothetical protein
MIRKLLLYLIVLICIRVNAQPLTKLEIAKNTASVTLWYPKAKIENGELDDKIILMQKKGESEWCIINSMNLSGKFKGYYLDNKYNLTNKTNLIDSADVQDWICLAEKTLYGAFVLRETNWKQAKQIAKKFDCFLHQNYITSQDFFDESKLYLNRGIEDTMGLYILKVRYPGGIKGFYSFIGSYIQYPDYARNRGLEGYTYTSFSLLPSGKIENITIIKTIGGSTQESVLDVCNKMPQWKTSDTDNTLILTLPVVFKLE